MTCKEAKKTVKTAFPTYSRISESDLKYSGPAGYFAPLVLVLLEGAGKDVAIGH